MLEFVVVVPVGTNYYQLLPVATSYYQSLPVTTSYHSSSQNLLVRIPSKLLQRLRRAQNSALHQLLVALVCARRKRDSGRLAVGV